jgi:hypothetical protein
MRSLISATRLSRDVPTRSAKVENGGGGNCTRGSVSVNICSKCGYDMASSGWPEHGREDEALRELVSNSHRLSLSVMHAIMELVRAG